MLVKSCLLIIFFMCFFMHACSVQHDFGITDLKKSPLMNKIKERVEISMSYSSNVKDAIVNSIPNNSLPKESDAAVYSVQKTGSKGVKSAGNENFNASLHKDLPTEPEGSRSDAEKVHHSSNLSEEDLLVTDYQPPHRKSPIHNK